MASDILNFLETIAQVEKETNQLTEALRIRIKELLGEKLKAELLEQHQYLVHGLSWLSTYNTALSQLYNWATNLQKEGKLEEAEILILQIGFGEYISQIIGGIPMSQNELFRVSDFIPDALLAYANNENVKALCTGNNDSARKRLMMCDKQFEGMSCFGNDGLDEDIAMVREQFYRYSEERVKPNAHEWHLKDEYIPLEVISELAELGVFGLTVPEEHGGIGMGKLAMCVVSEELSRGYIGVGSLGTRAEIAAELIMHGGTDAQKEKWLPKLVSGETLPTAVFTEPNTGSDLGSLKTRAVKSGEKYLVTGNKTWITHAARADLMTLMVRTDLNSTDYKGLSMMLAEKPRANDDTDFPAKGMSGGEIEVLGYRGMKEFERGFEEFEVPVENLLGGVEGQGFKQLMQTFESARIQTASRAIGVAQNAYELGARYAKERVQFDKPLSEFPRIYSKLALMVVEIMIARQLSYFAARQKDAGHRCDLEAGMAKLLAARIAWTSADNALQIHGGNGFALEYEISRVLCDARILNIFEGAAEIQAQVIGRRLLA